jgi:hypothetical protein
VCRKKLRLPRQKESSNALVDVSDISLCHQLKDDGSGNALEKKRGVAEQ